MITRVLNMKLRLIGVAALVAGLMLSLVGSPATAAPDGIGYTDSALEVVLGSVGISPDMKLAELAIDSEQLGHDAEAEPANNFYFNGSNTIHGYSGGNSWQHTTYGGGNGTGHINQRRYNSSAIGNTIRYRFHDGGTARCVKYGVVVRCSSG